MDLSQFATALLVIVVIDIVLAGDNAIVIALAARSLPAHLQRRAILWGVGCGLLLVWIAWRLLQPETGAAGSHGPVATAFWGAMRTIVIADAVMGLDSDHRAEDGAPPSRCQRPAGA